MTTLRRTFGGTLGDCAGLTLLEILIALAILGTGLAVIMQGLAQGLRVRRDSAETLRLSQVAENRLNHLLAQGEFSGDGDEGSEGPFSWRVEEAPLSWTPAAGPDEGRSQENLVPLRISVKAPSGREWELFTLLARGEENP